MNNKSRERYLLVLSLPILILLVAVSVIGVYEKDFYWRETSNWATQAIAQDMVDLFFIAPILLITSVLAYKNNFRAMLIWGGTILFIIYTFAIYCFAVHFNDVFFPYCLIFGLSIYSFIYFLYRNVCSTKDITADEKFPRKSTAIFLIVIAIVFYLLWFSEIIPAELSKTVPKSIAGTNAFTNPVHVLDLSVYLPGFILTAVLLLKKKSAGIILSLPVIVFCTEMAFSIMVLIIFMKNNNQSTDLTSLYFMGIIFLACVGFLIKIIKNIKHL